jgi:hypothetical protein
MAFGVWRLAFGVWRNGVAAWRRLAAQQTVAATVPLRAEA